MKCMLFGLLQIVDVTCEVAMVVVILARIDAHGCLEAIQVFLDALSFTSEQPVDVLYVCLTDFALSQLLKR